MTTETPDQSKPTRAVLARRRNASARRRKLLEDGGRRVDLLLGADAADALDRLERTTGDDATALITGLLLKARARRR